MDPRKTRKTDRVEIGPLVPDQRGAFVSLVRETWALAFAGSMTARDVARHLATTLSPDAINARLAVNTVLVARVNDRICAFRLGAGMPIAL